MGFRTFNDAYDDNDTPYYAVKNASETKYEYNRGAVFTEGSPSTLARGVWLSSNPGNTEVAWTEDDLPLIVYQPTSGELLQRMVQGWLSSARDAMLSFGFWFKQDDIDTDRHTIMLYDGDTDIPVGAVNAVTHKAWIAQKRTRVQSSTKRQYTTYTGIPIDNSIPQITEGAALTDFDCAVTIEKATSKIRVRGFVNMTADGLATHVIVTTTLNSDANAVAVSASYNAVAQGNVPIHFDVEIANPGAGSHTFRLRGGTPGANNVTLNGFNNAAQWGGVWYSYLEVIEEFQ